MYPYTIHLPDLKTEKITLGNKCRLKNFYRIGDGVYRSDQPSAACFRELEKFGMREILNLRCYHTDTKEAQGTSLILHHLPTRATLLRLTIWSLPCRSSATGKVPYSSIAGMAATGQEP